MYLLIHTRKYTYIELNIRVIINCSFLFTYEQ